MDRTRRIIPARAGFTRLGDSIASLSSDHPRSRGVYRARASVCSPVAGSSPLARGLPLAVMSVSFLSGIIPARAGFTRACPRHRRAPLDHPRSRGVYLWTVYWRDPSPGSSPLARGLRGLPGAGVDNDADHPRSRGVYRHRPHHARRQPGSSPLARGLPGGSNHPARCPRIIPARAGFTSRCEPYRWPDRDHPRSRGVYGRPTLYVTSQDGSSPLARGLLPCCSEIKGSNGIIPARAGFTAVAGVYLNLNPDHPRSRGVYSKSSAHTASVIGSSPLARGLLPRRR